MINFDTKLKRPSGLPHVGLPTVLCFFRMSDVKNIYTISMGDSYFETGIKDPTINGGRPTILEQYTGKEEAKLGHYKWKQKIMNGFGEDIMLSLNSLITLVLSKEKIKEGDEDLNKRNRLSITKTTIPNVMKIVISEGEYMFLDVEKNQIKFMTSKFSDFLNGMKKHIKKSD
jgi:hypothetical protein